MFRAIARELNTFWRKNDKYKPSTQRNSQYFCQKDDRQKIVSYKLCICSQLRCEVQTVQKRKAKRGHWTLEWPVSTNRRGHSLNFRRTQTDIGNVRGDAKQQT